MESGLRLQLLRQSLLKYVYYKIINTYLNIFINEYCLVKMDKITKIIKERLLEQN